ncbi:HPr family phosphocarrier protein [Marinimicrobium alkaliphilum]|uniref:HPr family phosphocarrier protein n=1 Tax=Marinimicrobium alkaliphilum TaxID=2202654 RepID=UPI000DB96D6F|nr:HPr family phosphocarrier protein [Marinimicrobium alkaliphilum]
MPQRTVTIVNKRGLHARAAAKFATAANLFSCRIQARTPEGSWVDGKSVMSLMLLAAAKGSCLEVATDGDDAEQALDTLCELIAQRFEEDE